MKDTKPKNYTPLLEASADDNLFAETHWDVSRILIKINFWVYRKPGGGLAGRFIEINANSFDDLRQRTSWAIDNGKIIGNRKEGFWIDMEQSAFLNCERFPTRQIAEAAHTVIINRLVKFRDFLLGIRDTDG